MRVGMAQGEMQSNSTRRWGPIVYLAGVLLGLALAIIAVWGDYEAMAYYEEGAGYDRFGGLSCPVLMSLSEAGRISATFDNSSTQVIQPYYEVDISATSSTRHMEDQLTVPARSSSAISWSVDANDVNLGSLILIKMDVLPVAGYSTREATCGIVVMHLGRLSGSAAFALWLGASLLAMVVGLVSRETGGEQPGTRDLNLQNGMRAAGVTTLLAMLFGLLGLWLIGTILAALTFLLLVILLRYTAPQS
jgi:hypothetical protein